VYPAALLMYFISAAVILLASLALIVQVSLPYNRNGRASVLYNFILVVLRGFCGLNTSYLRQELQRTFDPAPSPTRIPSYGLSL